MLWLEMSRDETHGGGSWGFGQCLWSPSRKTDGTRWSFWETLLDVKVGDPILHLRGKGNSAAFVGFSVAAADGFATEDRPPAPGEWGYADTFYRVPLQEFTLLSSPVLLREVFSRRDGELRTYFLNNRAAVEKERLFFVIQAGRLQCLKGAYLSQVSAALARLILDQPVYAQQPTHSLLQEVSTGEQLRGFMSRLGQTEFSDRVRKNYGMRCCFPDCDVAERGFLRGAHIARWSDAPDMRGDISNGLCLCLMHDQAFERGMFTIDLEYRIWVASDNANRSPWAQTHLLPYHKRQLRQGRILPSEEALLRHWERTSCYPV
jgi:hypothetical protein